MSVDYMVIEELYRDSVELMRVASEVRSEYSLQEAEAVMGTTANKEQIREQGTLTTEAVASATANDIILVATGEEKHVPEALETMAERIQSGEKRESSTSVAQESKTLASVNDDEPPSLALISIPGEHAVREAWRALHAGSHVQIFSDNVDIEAERELKLAGKKRGQLVMGPDCGTAIINGTPLGFANTVAEGSVGIVSASGTGLQEVATLVDRLGDGLTHAIGTGGRDLSETVGGVTTRQALTILDNDDETDVIVLVSKPPDEQARAAVLETVQNCTTPVVLSLLGNTDAPNANGMEVAPTLTTAANKAVAEVSDGDANLAGIKNEQFRECVSTRFADFSPTRTEIRGLFTGGTLCTEAGLLLEEELGSVASNTKVGASVEDASDTSGHALIDLGADEFTIGRPHPMIDPELRNRQFEAAIKEESVAIVLLDVVLGHGAHMNPASGIADALNTARDPPLVVASVTGTDADTQTRHSQVETLEHAGVQVAKSNAEAAKLVATAHELLTAQMEKA